MSGSSGSEHERAGTVLWPIELLHPDGEARRRGLLGSNCPPSFGTARPDLATGSHDSLDLLVIAPSAAECRDPVFLDDAFTTLVERLDPDGLGYVLVPLTCRAGVTRRLTRAGFRHGPAIVHLPAGASDQYLVPGTGPLLAHTVSDLMSLGPVRRRSIGVALRLPGVSALLGRLLPQVGIVVRRAGGRPLLEWLSTGEAGPTRGIIRTKWRANGGSAVLHCFAPDAEQPSWVAKVALSDDLIARTEREASALECLGPNAARAGARIPGSTVVRTATRRPVLLERRLEGRRASSLLQSRSIVAADLVALLVDWLESWSRLTVVPGVFEPAWWESEVLEPAQRLAPLLGSGPAYLEWLRGLGAGAVGSPMPRVATHNDLTTQNVLLERGLPLAILDWEAARDYGLPLADFFYAVVDAVAAGDREGPEESFVRCFHGGTPTADQVRRAGERLRQAAGVGAALVPVCFHACWIQHAANELRKKPEANRRPFLRIVDRLGSHPTAFQLPGSS